MSPSARRCLAAAALLAGTLTAHGEPIDPVPNELRGDPLPAGAARRLGTSSQQAVRAVAISPAGDLAATGNDAGELRLWSLADGKDLARVECGPAPAGGAAVDAVRFSPDGRVLAARRARWYFWDVASGKELRSLRGGPERFGALAFSPDGKVVALNRAEGSVGLWEVATGKLLDTVEALGTEERDRYEVLSLAYSPDGKTLALGFRGDQAVRLWDLAARRLGPTLPFRNQWAEVVAFSPDGAAVAAADSQLLALTVWDAVTGRELYFLDSTGHGTRQPLRPLAFSPDARLLASRGSGKAVTVRDARTGQEVLRLAGHDGLVTAVAFTPDGRLLVSGSADGTALVWPLDAGEKGPREAKELAARWGDLASDDAAVAYRAARALAGSAEGVAYLKGGVVPVTEALVQQLRKRIVELDDDSFEVREAASAELGLRLDVAEPLLRRALEDKPSPEVRRRIQRLLVALEGRATSWPAQRERRAVAALEWSGTAAADEVLRACAAGDPAAPLTGDARAALDRRKRTPVPRVPLAAGGLEALGRDKDSLEKPPAEWP